MKNNIFFIKDGNIDWLIYESKFFKNFNFTFIRKNIDYNKFGNRWLRMINCHLAYICLAFKSVNRSKKNDIIICWLDIIGIYSFFFSKIFFKNNRLVLLNLMLNNSNDIITKIKSKLFKYVISDKNTYFTLSSRYLFDYYDNILDLKLKKNCFLLNDTFEDLDNLKFKKPSDKKSIFCGGRNSRDWDLAFNLARVNAHLKFTYVVPNRNLVPKECPKNIQIFTNINKVQFYELMSNSSIVILPLKTDAPAGLIVLYAAAIMKKVVISSETLSVKEYISNNKTGMLVKKSNVKNFSYMISKCINNEELYEKLATGLNKSIIKKGSRKKYFETIISIVNKIN